METGEIVGGCPLAGARVALVRVTATGRRKVRLLAPRGAHKAGDEVLVGPGEYRKDEELSIGQLILGLLAFADAHAGGIWTGSGETMRFVSRLRNDRKLGLLGKYGVAP